MVGLSFLSLSSAAQGNRIKAESEPPPPPRPPIPQVFPVREEKTSEKPEVMPVFLGSYKKFLATNLQYPEEAKRKRQQGYAELEFVVNETGLVSGIQIRKSTGSALLDQEAMRVARLMESKAYWKPGKHKGTPVPVYTAIPISFKLSPATKPKTATKK